MNLPMTPFHNMNPIKPNLMAVIAALLVMAWLCRGLYSNIIEVMGALQGAETRTDYLEATNTLLLHLLGGALFMPIITALATMGVKLLDEKPDRPTVPADSHELLLRLLERERKLSTDVAGRVIDADERTNA